MRTPALTNVFAFTAKRDEVARFFDELLGLRRPTARDVPDILRLHYAALRSADADAGPGPWDDDLQDVDAVYLSVGGEFVVATHGAALIAMGALRRVDDTTAEVKRMRVSPQWQGQGIGRRVATYLEGRAVELGYTRLILDTTLRQDRALSLYESMGYRRAGEAVVAGLPSLLFEKRITADSPAVPRGRADLGESSAAVQPLKTAIEKDSEQ